MAETTERCSCADKLMPATLRPPHLAASSVGMYTSSSLGFQGKFEQRTTANELSNLNTTACAPNPPVEAPNAPPPVNLLKEVVTAVHRRVEFGGNGQQARVELGPRVIQSLKAPYGRRCFGANTEMFYVFSKTIGFFAVPSNALAFFG